MSNKWVGALLQMYIVTHWVLALHGHVSMVLVAGSICRYYHTVVDANVFLGIVCKDDYCRQAMLLFFAPILLVNTEHREDYAQSMCLMMC